MIVVHAPGNGLGHLTRVVAAHHTLGWTGPVVVLSSSARAAAAPLPAGVEVWPIPRAAATAREPLRAWLVDRVRDLEPEELWIDALPAGMWGEVDQPLLESMGDLPVHHLARLVRWPAYERANLAPHRPPHFTSTLLTEALPAPQVTWLRAHSAVAHTVELVDPRPVCRRTSRERCGSGRRGWWCTQAPTPRSSTSWDTRSTTAGRRGPRAPTTSCCARPSPPGRCATSCPARSPSSMWSRPGPCSHSRTGSSPPPGSTPCARSWPPASDTTSSPSPAGGTTSPPALDEHEKPGSGHFHYGRSANTLGP